MPAKLNVPANPEVGPAAAMIGAVCGDRKAEWKSDSGATFHMSRTRAGMIAYKEAPAGCLLRSLMGPFCR